MLSLLLVLLVLMLLMVLLLLLSLLLVLRRCSRRSCQPPKPRFSMKITHLLQHAYVFVSLVMCLHVFCWCCMWCGCGRGCNVVGAVCCKRAGNVPYVRCETMVMLLCCRSLSWMCHYRSHSVMRRISRLSRQRSSCETHVIHMSYTCHTRVIHIPYTRHMSHVIHMCRTCG